MTQYISQEGLEKLKKELERREKEIRLSIAKRIGDAKELGDLSENAEYLEAREEQSMNEGRIEELKEIIRSAVVVDNDRKGGEISIGSKVTAVCNGQERHFVIVGANEAEPLRGFVSNESPIGLAFLGRKEGEEVDVETPGGKVKYKILEVK